MHSLSAIRLAVVALSVSGSALFAQESIQLEPGARVRLVTSALPENQRVVRIVSTGNDTISFRSERNPMTQSVAVRDITAIEVSTGKRRNTLRGAMMGLGAGVGVGAVLGYATYEECEGWCILAPSSPGGSAALGATAGGLIGIVAGTAIGFMTQTEKWQRLQSNPRISVNPMSQGPLVSLSYSF